jgi:hypothetical protein
MGRRSPTAADFERGPLVDLYSPRVPEDDTADRLLLAYTAALRDFRERRSDWPSVKQALSDWQAARWAAAVARQRMTT